MIFFRSQMPFVIIRLFQLVIRRFLTNLIDNAVRILNIESYDVKKVVQGASALAAGSHHVLIVNKHVTDWIVTRKSLYNGYNSVPRKRNPVGDEEKCKDLLFEMVRKQMMARRCPVCRTERKKKSA